MHPISIRCFILFALGNLFLGVSSYGQTQWWQKTAKSELRSAVQKERNITTDIDRYIRLNQEELISQLKQAEQKESYEISIPNLSGRQETFLIQEARIMQKGLQEKYPEIRAYQGVSTENPDRLIRIDRNPSAVHFFISGSNMEWFIDPVYRSADDLYLIYQHEEIEQSKLPICQHHPTAYSEGLLQPRGTAQKIEHRVQEYRLAVSTSYEYYEAFGSTIEGTLAGIVNTINRVNMVFERDFGIRMVLVANNDALIVTNSSSRVFTRVEDALSENRTFLRTRIGDRNYDVGHVFGIGEQGIASIRSVCDNLNKARGYTALSGRQGNPVDLYIAAHEFGHQFGANHTFNGIIGACSDDNRSNFTAFEPGSGSTIMSYVGICGSDNFEGSRSSDYFHGGSIEEVFQYAIMGFGASCATFDTTNNRAPIIIPPKEGLYIPYLTPFELEAKAEDLEGDQLTYCWEQMDIGVPSALGEFGFGNNPLFRSFPPSASPKRTFPNLDDLRNNRSERSESLPKNERGLKFRLTVRDNNKEGGAISWTNLNYQVTDRAGPFVVENPDPFYSGAYLDLKWDVANTNLPPVGTDSVSVSLSLNRGITFDMELGTFANTGQAFVYIPAGINTRNARIKVKAKDNIFFDINDNNQFIQPVESAEPKVELLGKFEELSFCSSNEIKIPILLNLFGGLAMDTTSILVRTEGFNANLNPSDDQPNAFTLELLGGQDLAAGEYLVEISANNGNLSDSLSFSVNLSPSPDGLTIELQEPFDQSNIAGLQPNFSWLGDPLADNYQLELGTDIDFDNIIYTSEILEDTSLSLNFMLEEQNEYFWRVKANNEFCGISTTSIPQSFTALNVVCEIFRPEDLPLEFNTDSFIQSFIDVDLDAIILDANVLNVAGTYPMPNKGLSFRLESPEGSILDLVARDDTCSSGNTFSFSLDDQAEGMMLPCPNDEDVFIVPDTMLSTLNGQNGFGRWTLTVFDDGADGQLSNWALEICYASSSVTSSRNLFTNAALLNVFPNPTNSKLNFQLSNGGLAALVITDITGRPIYQLERIQEASLDLNISNWKAGIYIYSVLSEAGEVFSGKLIKN